MTKGQNRAVDFIENHINNNKSFQWYQLVEFVKEKAKVRNWMTIRSILQIAKNEGYIKRDENIHLEKYIIISK